MLHSILEEVERHEVVPHQDFLFDVVNRFIGVKVGEYEIAHRSVSE